MANAKPAIIPTRGERNNNPGNIDYKPRNKWVGQIGLEPPPAPGKPARFARFDSPLNGGRAMVVLLQNYRDDKGLKTVAEIIATWAPGNENNTAAYIRAVATALGVDPDAAIDVYDYRTMRTLVEAIIRHENGRVIYTPDEITEMLRRGGIVDPNAPAVPVPPKKPPVKSVIAAATSTIGAPAAGAVAVLSDPRLKEAVESTGIPWLIIAFGALGICATGVLLWHTLRNKPAPGAAA